MMQHILTTLFLHHATHHPMSPMVLLSPVLRVSESNPLSLQLVVVIYETSTEAHNTHLKGVQGQNVASAIGVISWCIQYMSMYINQIIVGCCSWDQHLQIAILRIQNETFESRLCSHVCYHTHKVHLYVYFVA